MNEQELRQMCIQMVMDKMQGTATDLIAAADMIFQYITKGVENPLPQPTYDQ